MAHIDLSREADLILVAPASADFLKVAHGLADDLLTTMVLARDCPLLAAPAMNKQMWENPATQRNVATLTVDGVTVLGPRLRRAGLQRDRRRANAGAGRDSGRPDRLPAAEGAGRQKVLITAGPTFEAIDPVRGITNLSSGKMGFAVARAAREAGADVTLVCGPVCQTTPRGVTRIDVAGALDMHREVMARAATQDVFIGVAAVADYRPQAAAEHKIKKDDGTVPTIALVENPDILAEVAALPNPPLCVGFAAETATSPSTRRRSAEEENSADCRQPDPARFRWRGQHAGAVR